jgi:predicted dehydrogenase
MRIAVLGCGSIGRRHLLNLRSLGCVETVCFDPDPEARRAAETVADVPAFSSLEAVWATNPDAVLITAATHEHVELALAAARRGCHLFIEKPLSHALDGRLAELLAEVERRDLITMVACNMRFHPGPATVKRWLEAAAVGEVVAARIQTGSYLPRWHPASDYRRSYSASPDSGGAVLDCIHEIDLALWYFGPAKVAGAVVLPATHLGIQTDGLAEILLCHASGVLSSVHVNFIQRDYRRASQIIGSEGSLYWDFGERRALRFGKDGEPAESVPEPVDWPVNRMYVDEMEHFLQSVERRRPTVNPISGGVAALEIALAVKRAGAIQS